jgi:hypothetical protein
VGLLVGTAVAFSASDGVRRIRSASLASQLLAVTHVPPLLTVSGESPVLRFDVYCDSGVEGSEDVTCEAGGIVYVRAATGGAFRALPLQFDAAATAGRYFTRVPLDIASSTLGFQYYAVVRDTVSGRSTIVPTGGSSAPLWSRWLGRATVVDLGAHAFGAVRAADARVASAAWGTGAGEVGLEDGVQQEPIGASSFDVDSSGAVSLLDEVNHRLLRFGADGDATTTVPLAVSGREADLALESDGSIDVLELPAIDQPMPLLSSFDPSGQLRSTTQVADPIASQVRAGEGGPSVLQYPSGQWVPVRFGGVVDQLGAARAGRPLTGGGELVIRRVGSEVRLALVSNSGVIRSWRVLSDTPLAEVQLAEPIGSGVVLVVRTYTDTADEFVVLVLDQSGVVRRFSLDSADWAETAPLSRFRLKGGSLYRLGSTEAGVFVDRYDLGVQ